MTGDGHRARRVLCALAIAALASACGAGPVGPPVVTTPPTVLERTPLRLPNIHVLQGIRAEVRLRVHIDAAGRAGEIEVRHAAAYSSDTTRHGTGRARAFATAMAPSIVRGWRFAPARGPDGPVPAWLDVELASDLRAQRAAAYRRPEEPAGAIHLPPAHLRVPRGRTNGQPVRLLRTVAPIGQPNDVWVLQGSGDPATDVEAAYALGRLPTTPVRDALGQVRVGWQEVVVDFVRGRPSPPRPAVAISHAEGWAREREAAEARAAEQRRARAEAEAKAARQAQARWRAELRAGARACRSADATGPDRVEVRWPLGKRGRLGPGVVYNARGGRGLPLSLKLCVESWVATTPFPAIPPDEARALRSPRRQPFTCAIDLAVDE